jgi:Spy/CpxP family protein refolding chaperone
MKKMIVILSAFILLTQGTVGAEHPGRGPGRGPAVSWMIIYKDNYCSASRVAATGLNLTQEQTTRLQLMNEKNKREIELLHARFYDKGKLLKAEWLQTEPDRRRIETLQGEVSMLQRQMQEKMADQRVEVLNVLTTEQRSRVEEAEHSYHAHHNRFGFGPIKERK